MAMDWISVDEKPPEIGQQIICTGIKGKVFMGYYQGCDVGAFQRMRHVVSLSKDPVSTRRTEIEAWMPAPEPYSNLKKQKAFLAIRQKYYTSHLNIQKRRP